MEKRALRPHPTDPDALLVPLGKDGKRWAIIDREDADFVSTQNWQLLEVRGHENAKAAVKQVDGGFLPVRLHRWVAQRLGIAGDDVEAIDGSLLNCRSSNLRPRRSAVEVKPKYTVYQLQGPDGAPRYVGSTSARLHRRLSGHLGSAKNGTVTPVYGWIRFLQATGQRPKIVELASAESEAEALELEDFHMARLRKEGANLLNRQTATDRVWSEASRQKISKSKKGVLPDLSPLFCLTNGKTYSGPTAAANDLDLNQSNVCQALKRQGTTGGYKFLRVQPANDNASPAASKVSK